MQRQRSTSFWGARLAAKAANLLTLLSLVFLSNTALGSGRQLAAEDNLITITAKMASAGRLPATNDLSLAIGLPLRDQAGLTTFLHDLYDPASARFHQYLTPEQFTERFGPTVADYQAVMDFARSNNLEVVKTYGNRMLVDVRGKVPDIEKTFGVHLLTYHHPTEARDFYAPDANPTVEDHLRMRAVRGLDNYDQPRPLYRTMPLGKGVALDSTGSGPQGFFSGYDFRDAYAPDVTNTGTGQSVALFELDGYYTNDITYYESTNGLPNVSLTNVVLGGASGMVNDTNAEFEVALDIEMSVAMAPGLSRVIVYEAPLTSVGCYDILNQMAADNNARQISSSWSFDQVVSTPVPDQIYQEYAAQGQSFFQASGDSGAYAGPGVPVASNPYLTAVGGTILTTTGPGGAYVSESVWQQGNAASGGGIVAFPIPTYQVGISMGANGGSTTQRNMPDVALTAEQVYLRADGVDSGIGGTSCAAPLWAGFMALINQEAAANGKPPIGFLNPSIYALGQSANYASTLHDITDGNNFNSSSPNSYIAVPGYDLCTGWGTPMGQSVINALVAAAVPLQFAVVTTASDSGPGSLRSTILNAASGSTVIFTNTLSGQTITLTSGQLVLTNNLTIDASELAEGIWINGNTNSRIFLIHSGANVALNGLTLTNGNAQGDLGGGINNAGTLSVNRCLIVSNTTTGPGGGIYNSGTLTVNASTFASNSSASLFQAGGGIANSGALTVTQCTFTGNSANGGGAIFSSSGTLDVQQSTISSNIAFCCGGGISLYADSGNQTVVNTIVAANSGGDIYYATTNFTALTNVLTGINPQLAPLGNYGGPTLTMPPLPGSPAIGGGSVEDAGAFATDQRDFPRLSGALVDIGAVEFQDTTAVTLPAGDIAGNSATLNGTVDPGDGPATYYFQYGLTTNYGSVTATSLLSATNSPVAVSATVTGLELGELYNFQLVATRSAGTTYGGDLTLQTFAGTNFVMNTNDSGNGSLREAIAGVEPGGFVYFATNLSGQTITLTSGEIDLTTNITIDGSGLSNGVQINGDGNSCVFVIDSGTVELNSLTITNGYDSVGDVAGGIANFDTLTVNNCTIAGNVAVAGAGGVYSDGTMWMNDCTLAGNSAPSANGGGIYNDGTLTINNCTVAGNSAPEGMGGGIFIDSGVLTFTNTIVCDNTAATNENVAGDYSPAYNLVDTNALLAPLGNYGGPTATMPPLGGSPAVNTGSDTVLSFLTTDQRGYPRLSGAHVDIGAVEAQIATVRPLLNSVSLSGSGGSAKVRFSFTNLVGGSFTVFATTNLALPFNKWLNLGAMPEMPIGSGHFQFTDSLAANSPHRFYEVSSP